MMSAVKMRTLVSSASSRASLVTGTSKARMHAYFERPCACLQARLCPQDALESPSRWKFFKYRCCFNMTAQVQAHACLMGPPVEPNQLTFSSMTLARMTSFLWMGPMAMPLTGILTAGERRNSSSASSEPSVLACTHTPSPAQAAQRDLSNYETPMHRKPIFLNITCMTQE